MRDYTRAPLARAPRNRSNLSITLNLIVNSSIEYRDLRSTLKLSVWLLQLSIQ